VEGPAVAGGLDARRTGCRSPSTA